ncbi:MAG TPA: hypothetical protein VI977_03290 [archaeon]|nr:hypothetical protein [archaeon]
MADKKKVLQDGIKKLLSLKVPEEEIISNLSEIGISGSYARQLIEEAKTGKETQEAEKEKTEEETEENAAANKDIESEMGFEDEKPDEEITRPEEEKTAQEEALEESAPKEETEESEKSIEEELEETETDEKQAGEKEWDVPKPKEIFMDNEKQETEEAEELEEKEEEEEPAEKGKNQKAASTEKMLAKLAKKTSGSKKSEAVLAGLWKKGILTTVSQNLAEMKKIRADIESALNKRASAIAKKEVDKVKAFFDAQRTLILESVDSRLEQKTKQLDKMLDDKIRELKEVSKEIKADSAKLEKLRGTQKDGLRQVAETLEGLEEAKNSLVSEMNSELMKSKSAVEEFLEKSQKKLDEIDARINETLQLESSIVEGLVRDADAKIDEAVAKRVAKKT